MNALRKIQAPLLKLTKDASPEASREPKESMISPEVDQALRMQSAEVRAQVQKSLRQWVEPQIGTMPAEFHELRMLADAIEPLTPQGFRSIIGLLNIVRDSKITTSLASLLKRYIENSHNEEATKYLLTLIKEQWELYRKTGDEKEEEHFASEMLKFIRMLCPHGVNVLNPVQDPNTPSFLSAENAVTIKLLETLFLVVEPQDVDTSLVQVVETRYGHMYLKNNAILKNNEPMIAGRDIVIADIFGKKMDFPMRISAQLPIANPAISRGGLMLTRSEGKLYVFDRGSKSKIQVMQGDMQMFYEPATVVLKNGDISFGNSQVFLPDRDGKDLISAIMRWIQQKETP